MRSVQKTNPPTTKPRLVPPPGACDTHLHVYGTTEKYPLSRERNYTPDLHSTLDDYLQVHRSLGLQRAIIVTGSANGTNNEVTVDALSRMKGNFKGLALLSPRIKESELVGLKEAGFIGFRIKANGRGGLSFEDSKKMIAHVRGFEWHVEFMSESMAEVLDAVSFLKSLGLPYVFDHVAHAAPFHNAADRAFSKLLAVLSNEEHAWINLYSFYQSSKIGPPHYTDMIDVVRSIIEARPDRVIWGSNWPHAGIAGPMPHDADLLDFLLAAAPEEDLRKQILAENPANLYGWHPI